jgi:acetoin utilization protein AcuB
MLVRKWMSKNPIVIEESASLSEAINLLKKHKIRRLPVMKKGKLAGILSDRDLKEASPSKATSLDIWELHYLMSNIIVKTIMKKNVVTVSPDTTLERAAILMYDNKIGGLPVLDSNKKLVGILTEQDVFKALINISGARFAANRISIILKDTPGSIKEMMDVMRKYKFKYNSILTTHEGVKEGFREVLIRFQAEKSEVDNILKDLKANYDNVELTID